MKVKKNSAVRYTTRVSGHCRQAGTVFGGLSPLVPGNWWRFSFLRS